MSYNKNPTPLLGASHLALRKFSQNYENFKIFITRHIVRIYLYPYYVTFRAMSRYARLCGALARKMARKAPRRVKYLSTGCLWRLLAPIGASWLAPACQKSPKATSKRYLTPLAAWWRQLSRTSATSGVKPSTSI